MQSQLARLAHMALAGAALTCMLTHAELEVECRVASIGLLTIVSLQHLHVDGGFSYVRKLENQPDAAQLI